MLVYYSDKSEKKPRGGAYFNAITDVYFDHSAMKNNRTFIVKTKNRSYTLQAPSQQACSIWIDVIMRFNDKASSNCREAVLAHYCFTSDDRLTRLRCRQLVELFYGSY